MSHYIDLESKKLGRRLTLMDADFLSAQICVNLRPNEICQPIRGQDIRRQLLESREANDVLLANLDDRAKRIHPRVA